MAVVVVEVSVNDYIWVIILLFLAMFAGIQCDKTLFEFISNVYYYQIILHILFSVMACAPPTITLGGTFSCDGTTTDWGGLCHLECDSSIGYTGDTDIICNADDGDESVSWNAMPTCTRKHEFW